MLNLADAVDEINDMTIIRMSLLQEMIDEIMELRALLADGSNAVFLHFDGDVCDEKGGIMQWYNRVVEKLNEIKAHDDQAANNNGSC